jgi:hypothetical protein
LVVCRYRFIDNWRDSVIVVASRREIYLCVKVVGCQSREYCGIANKILFSGNTHVKTRILQMAYYPPDHWNYPDNK